MHSISVHFKLEPVPESGVEGWREREREDYDDDGVEGGGGLKNTFYLVFFPCFCVSERLECGS